MSWRPFLLPVLALSLALVGCGGAGQPAAAPMEPLAPPAGGANKAAPAGAVDPAAAATPRAQMIVYTATLDVVVKDLDAARAEVEKLVAGHKGFVAKSEVRGDPGSPRLATYALRVPTAGFAPLKEGLLALGHAERNAVETQDVTEEFVDVEARIKNLQEQERKLNELLAEKRKEEKLEDVIKVSDRIYLVRGDIERAQGRRNYLLNKVQLSTVNLTLREIKDYTPPTAPTFSSRVSETFSSSWDAVVTFGERLVLVGVALVPWAPLWLPLLGMGAWGVRRMARASREAARREEEIRSRRGHRPHDGRHEPPVEPAAPAEPVRPPEGEAGA
jgi:hypothetical protein